MCPVNFRFQNFDPRGSRRARRKSSNDCFGTGATAGTPSPAGPAPGGGGPAASFAREQHQQRRKWQQCGRAVREATASGTATALGTRHIVQPSERRATVQLEVERLPHQHPQLLQTPQGRGGLCGCHFGL